MSDESNGNGDDNGNGNEKVQFRKKDGIEKDGYICFPVDLPPEEVEQEQEEQEEEKEVPKARGKLGTCPDDPRFQQANKTKWCGRMYVDYHRCKLLLGENCRNCDYFYNCYNSICPNSWTERWDEQIKNGNFPYDFSREETTPQPPPCS